MKSSDSGDDPFYAASLMKLALVIAVSKQIDAGTIESDTVLPLTRSFISPVDGLSFAIEEDSADPFFDPDLRSEARLATVMRRSITVSSNEATNMLIDLVGFEAINAVYRACGAINSFVERHVFDEAARVVGKTNIITANDATAVLHAVLTGGVLTPLTSLKIKEWLLGQEQRSLIPASLPNSIVVGNKEGETSVVRHDLAFVEVPKVGWYSLAILTHGFSTREATERIHQTAITLHNEFVGASR